MKKSGTAPWHAGDENGPLNLRDRQGLRPSAPGVGQPQSRLEKFPQMSPDQKPAQQVQIRLNFQTVHENGKRRFDWGVAKIPQPGSTTCLFTQRFAL